MKREIRKKYKILQKLKQLPHEEFLFIKEHFPNLLGVSKSTFERWLYLPVNSNSDIPTEKLAIIAKYLNCTIEELINYKIKKINFKKLKQKISKIILKDLGLIKDF